MADFCFAWGFLDEIDEALSRPTPVDSASDSMMRPVGVSRKRTGAVMTIFPRKFSESDCRCLRR